MYTEILHHIERLQLELAQVDPRGQSAAVAQAVAQIAAGLRGPLAAAELNGENHPSTNGQFKPVFMQ